MIKLKRANYAFDVIRVQFIRSLRVYLRKFRKECLIPLFFGAFCKIFSVFEVCFGFGKTYIFYEGSNIKSGSACDNRNLSA